MEQEGVRYCDGCRQPLPPKALMGRQTMSKEEARIYRPDATENPDGTVTIDLCLACRIRRLGGNA
jgi:hypothetical protein